MRSQSTAAVSSVKNFNGPVCHWKHLFSCRNLKCTIDDFTSSCQIPSNLHCSPHFVSTTNLRFSTIRCFLHYWNKKKYAAVFKRNSHFFTLWKQAKSLIWTGDLHSCLDWVQSTTPVKCLPFQCCVFFYILRPSDQVATTLVQCRPAVVNHMMKFLRMYRVVMIENRRFAILLNSIILIFWKFPF